MEEDTHIHELEDGQGDTPVGGFDSDAPRPFGNASIVDALRADYEELASSTDVYIPVKGYERIGLQIKYHMPGRGKELDEIGRKVEREFKDKYSRNLYIGIDVMIHLCSGLYVQPEGVDEPVMLDPEDTGAPCMFDERLAEILGFTGLSSARQVVRKLFANNDIAVVYHSEKLNRWLQNSKADLSLEIWQLGE